MKEDIKRVFFGFEIFTHWLKTPKENKIISELKTVEKLVFPSTYICNYKTMKLFRPRGKLKLNYSSRPFIYKSYTPELVKKYEQAEQLYLDVLLREIVELEFLMFNSGWLIEMEHFDLPSKVNSTSYGPREDNKQESYSLFTWEQIREIAGNIPTFSFDKEAKRMHEEVRFPPDTTLEIIRKERTGSILLSNPFLTMKIDIRHDLTERGLGHFGDLLSYDKGKSKQYDCINYVVTVTVDYKMLKSGNPQMAKQKIWVKAFLSELQRWFDSEKEWKETKEEFIFTNNVRRPQEIGRAHV